jgi:hypothetical protein
MTSKAGQNFGQLTTLPGRLPSQVYVSRIADAEPRLSSKSAPAECPRHGFLIPWSALSTGSRQRRGPGQQPKRGRQVLT